MTGLVDQLQADALDHNVPVSTLLRKVKVSAAKLGLQNTLTWVDHELNGYRTVHGDDLPQYRRGHGIPIAQDEFGRWVPMQFADSEMEAQISMAYLKEPVSNYEELLRHDSGTFDLPVDSALVNALGNAFGVHIVAMRTKISRGQIHGIVQHVRNLVLDWSLELAQAGITGRGLGFTDKERDRANISHISIGSFTGSLNTGNARGDGSKIMQTYTHVANDMPAIADLIAAVQDQVDDTAQKEAIIAAAQQIAGAQDKPSMLAGYERLLSAAANHMTVIAPFLPAIGSMLAS